ALDLFLVRTLSGRLGLHSQCQSLSFTLAALLAKPLVGGYVAGMCPFWVASGALTNIPLPYWFPWVLTVASIAAVTVVEPTMFIGFVLLYLEMSALPPSSSEALATQLA